MYPKKDLDRGIGEGSEGVSFKGRWGLSGGGVGVGLEGDRKMDLTPFCFFGGMTPFWGHDPFLGA
ncbi:MAG: hypothetical protein OXC84_10135 [Gammaproteobacteria bacterium]|nr:hypothetical protein [Gammaproteobacteria bacterium]